MSDMWLDPLGLAGLNNNNELERMALESDLVVVIGQRDRARDIAAHLEAENHQLIEAAQRLISHYIGTNLDALCPNVDTCACPLGHITRLLER